MYENLGIHELSKPTYGLDIPNTYNIDDILKENMLKRY